MWKPQVKKRVAHLINSINTGIGCFNDYLAVISTVSKSLNNTRLCITRLTKLNISSPCSRFLSSSRYTLLLDEFWAHFSSVRATGKRKKQPLIPSLGYEYIVGKKKWGFQFLGGFRGRKGFFPNPGVSYPSMVSLGLMNGLVSRRYTVSGITLTSRVTSLMRSVATVGECHPEITDREIGWPLWSWTVLKL